jgi:chromosome segregation ATPase
MDNNLKDAVMDFLYFAERLDIRLYGWMGDGDALDPDDEHDSKMIDELLNEWLKTRDKVKKKSPQENPALRYHIDFLLESNSSLLEQLDKLRQENKELENQIKDYQEDFKEYQEDVDKLRKENEELKATLKQDQQRLALYRTHHEDSLHLQEEIAELRRFKQDATRLNPEEWQESKGPAQLRDQWQLNVEKYIRRQMEYITYFNLAFFNQENHLQSDEWKRLVDAASFVLRLEKEEEEENG